MRVNAKDGQLVKTEDETMKRIITCFAGILLLCALCVHLTACAMPVEATNLMDGISPRKITPSSEMEAGNIAASDFAVRLFLANVGAGENTLVSPLSVLCALAMTANGAVGDTLSGMEQALGMSVSELNLYLYSYLSSLPSGEKYKVSVANSIWFTEDESFTVGEDFLQLNADYYGADIYKAPFDSGTLRDINNWVKSNTDGMIPKILDDIPKEAVMYLINAIAFEAEWSKFYETHQVRDGEFTKADGTKQTVDMMYSSEGRYLEDDNAIGFMKYYRGSRYAFAALLPDENMSIEEYVSSLNGEKLQAILSGSVSATVNAAMPKFEVEWSAELSKELSAMGMDIAFDPELADFSSLGTAIDGNIYIDKVIHKTYIKVGEKGTRAGAATAVAMNKAEAADPVQPKKVYLDRPFVYMIVDTENNVPIFIGTLTDAKN